MAGETQKTPRMGEQGFPSAAGATQVAPPMEPALGWHQPPAPQLTYLSPTTPQAFPGLAISLALQTFVVGLHTAPPTMPQSLAAAHGAPSGSGDAHVPPRQARLTGQG
jgi:hypothetical protein